LSPKSSSTSSQTSFTALFESDGGKIASSLGVASENDRQLIVILYMAGFAAGQIFFGPLSDR
jgi:hypothetical protein